MTEKTGKERRQFYRLDDEVILEYHPLAEGESEPDTSVDEDEPIMNFMQIVTEFKEIDLASQVSLQEISLKNSKLANYLRLQNKKMDMLVQYLTEDLLAKFILRADTRPTELVNLSAGGIAFFADKEFAVGGRYQLKVIMLPRYYCVVSTAEVVSCNKLSQDPAKPYRISLKFEELSEANEQLIVRHIYERQIAERQARQSANDSDEE